MTPDELNAIRARAEAANAELNILYHNSKVGDKTYSILIKAYNDIHYLLSEVERLTARAEKAEAERDRAVKQMCQFCRSLDKKAGINPVCAASCEWRGLGGDKDDADN